MIGAANYDVCPNQSSFCFGLAPPLTYLLQRLSKNSSEPVLLASPRETCPASTNSIYLPQLPTVDTSVDLLY